MNATEDRDPDTGRLRPPQLRPVVPHVCDAGVTPCGAAARLFPAGWLCGDHAPRTKAA
jgi:hypothetical protein